MAMAGGEKAAMLQHVGFKKPIVFGGSQLEQELKRFDLAVFCRSKEGGIESPVLDEECDFRHHFKEEEFQDIDVAKRRCAKAAAVDETFFDEQEVFGKGFLEEKF